MGLNLNDRAVMTELDPHGILNLTEQFPNQCRRAFEIARNTPTPTLDPAPTVAILTGLGGSAAGGDFARALFEAQGAIPFFVNRDYHLPSFVGPTTVVFCASYSGNTEETLSAYADAKAAGAQIVCVTSGGELLRRANADGYRAYVVPGGQPPRTALGFMLIPVLVACVGMGLLPEQPFEQVFDNLEAAAATWTVEGSDDSAKRLAERLHGALPIVYGLGGWQTLIANRWRSQINENAKNLAFFNGYPELCHNEIMGWVTASEIGVSKFVGVLLTDGAESLAMVTRAKVTSELIAKNIEFQTVNVGGDSLLEKLLKLAFFGDFTSVYLARLNGVDPENIDSINALKVALSKIG